MGALLTAYYLFPANGLSGKEEQVGNQRSNDDAHVESEHFPAALLRVQAFAFARCGMLLRRNKAQRNGDPQDAIP